VCLSTFEIEIAREGTPSSVQKLDKKEKKKKERKDDGKESDEHCIHYVLCLDTVMRGLPVELALSLGLNRTSGIGISRDFSFPFFLNRVRHIVTLKEASKLPPVPYQAYNYATSFARKCVTLHTLYID
jgi:hypothetical protein